MTKHENGKRETVRLKRIEVCAEHNQVERFTKSVLRRPELPADWEANVPMTFAASWLSALMVEETLASLLGSAFDSERDALLHLGQTIEMNGSLSVGGDYLLDVEISKPNPNGQFEVSVEIRDAEGALLLIMKGNFLIHRPKQ